MTDTKEQLSQLLREASETHHRVFRIVDGADDDWASWYAWWLINLSELPTVLDATPVRSELIYLLVNQNTQYIAAQSGKPWEFEYARRIRPHPADARPAVPSDLHESMVGRSRRGPAERPGGSRTSSWPCWFLAAGQR